MKVSLSWLQKYFEKPLPQVRAIAEALTFHAFEIEEATGDLLDVKVLPNRAADCLCHRGIATELSAILGMRIQSDPLRETLPAFPLAQELTITVEDPGKCARYMGALVRGVTVGPSPQWLREALESVGQRSINNIVDAANYVMLSIGQPLHAFDAGKLHEKNGTRALGVRSARQGESITTLTGETYALPDSALVITDAHQDIPIGIAGVKGGKTAEVTATTTDLVIESANFDGTITRKTAQTLKLTTDASVRFQNRPSPQLCAYGMRDVLSLITDIAGGEIVGVVDEYPSAPTLPSVSVSLARVNDVLGSSFSCAEVEEVFTRLGLTTRTDGEIFTVTPPFERTDIIIPEDLIEEAGRILGYDRIDPQELPPGEPGDQSRFCGIERMKDMLVEQGFTEVSTQSFTKEGDILLANPFDKEKPALRTSLEENLKEALTRAHYYAPLVLLPGQKPKLFEVGTVFPKSGEYLELRMTERVPHWGESAHTTDNLSVAKLEDYGRDYRPKRYALGSYQPFSVYPFIVRDIALWVPTGERQEDILSRILESAGDLVVRSSLFDTFGKGEKVSYAFRLVFQASDRTLTDREVNSVMEGVTKMLVKKGYEIR